MEENYFFLTSILILLHRINSMNPFIHPFLLHFHFNSFYERRSFQNNWTKVIEGITKEKIKQSIHKKN